MQNDIAFSQLASQYPFLQLLDAGKTLLGNEIPLFRIGNGAPNILFLAGSDAAEDISESVLRYFLSDLCACISANKRPYGMNCTYLNENRSIWILPRINPDGRNIVLNGPDPACMLYERQLRLNSMKNDFSAWHGNARGVFPSLNYNDHFLAHKNACLKETPDLAHSFGEYPESEPESAAVARLIRTLDPLYVMEFCKGSDVIFHSGLVSSDPTLRMAKQSGFSLSDAPFFGAAAWFHQLTRRPAFLIAGNSDTKSSSFFVYSRLREFLFRSPMLIGKTSVHNKL